MAEFTRQIQLRSPKSACRDIKLLNVPPVTEVDVAVASRDWYFGIAKAQLHRSNSRPSVGAGPPCRHALTSLEVATHADMPVSVDAYRHADQLHAVKTSELLKEASMKSAG